MAGYNVCSYCGQDFPFFSSFGIFRNMTSRKHVCFGIFRNMTSRKHVCFGIFRNMTSRKHVCFGIFRNMTSRKHVCFGIFRNMTSRKHVCFGIFRNMTSRKHVCVMYASLNPTFIQKNEVYRSKRIFLNFYSKHRLRIPIRIASANYLHQYQVLFL